MDVEGGVSQEMLLQNYTKLRDSHLDWETSEDTAIFKFIEGYFQQWLEMPSFTTVNDYFEATKDTEIVERLKVVFSAQVHVRTNFTHLLSGILEAQAQIKTSNLLKKTIDIVTKGIVLKEKGEDAVRLHGVRDGLSYFSQNAVELIAPIGSVKQRGDIRLDGQDVWNEYLTAKINKDKVWGKFTGLNKIDTICHGLKKGELHIHTAYAGELKTTLATNWAYNLVTRFRTNVFYGAFEMKREHIRRLIYVLHSANNRWPGLGYPKPLDYRKVRDGELSPEEEKFYQLVIDDFCNNPNYCEFHLWEPDHDINIDEVRQETELLHRQIELGFVVLDHGGNMEARKKKRNKDYVIELNSVIRDTKKFALHFNFGEGIPVLLLFQINRQGKLEAEKNDGVYRMNAIAYANEAERSADVITTTYLDNKLRDAGETKICNLKNRDNPLFEHFNAEVDFNCRRLRNLETSSGNGMSCDDEMRMLTGSISA